MSTKTLGMCVRLCCIRIEVTMSPSVQCGTVQDLPRVAALNTSGHNNVKAKE